MYMFAYICIHSLNVKFLNMVKYFETKIKLFVSNLKCLLNDTALLGENQIFHSASRVLHASLFSKKLILLETVLQNLNTLHDHRSV